MTDGAGTDHRQFSLGLLRGAGGANVWCYQTMMVGAQRVWLEHGYGTLSPETLAVEARVLAAATAAVVVATRRRRHP